MPFTTTNTPGTQNDCLITTAQLFRIILSGYGARSLPTDAYIHASFATAEDFYTAILTERNMEFLGEGMRNIDLMRLSLTFP